MNRYHVMAERMETLRQLLNSEGTVTSTEIHIHFSTMGLSEKQIAYVISFSFKAGLIHRRKIENQTGYKYRLAEKYPTWGVRYIPKGEQRNLVRPVVYSCKRKSKIYQLDQLLKSVRGQHANDMVLP